ncbi:MAG: leucine-rich repeat protein, partial [Muribaculaceae bacterium]|nr:leucine-rich repeat protein [Muribaculaceae bacterium]
PPRNGESLKSIPHPADLYTSRFAAFQGCKALKNIKLPESLKNIDDRAFKGCESMENIVIPDRVTDVGINAFEDCKSLKEVKVGNGVKEIGQWAFFNCTDMEKLTLGSSLESIGAQAFDGDINIREITCLSPEPPSFPGGFPEEVMENATVTVPEGSEFAYNASPEWDPMVEGEVQKAERIILNYAEIELQPKESVTLTAEVLPIDAVNKEVIWSSDDYYVAKVDENGIVTAKDYGTAVITATCGDVTAECLVRVVDPDSVDSLLSGLENTVDVYDANGILLRKDVSKEVLEEMTPGMYIVRKGDKLQKTIIR